MYTRPAIQTVGILRTPQPRLGIIIRKLINVNNNICEYISSNFNLKASAIECNRAMLNLSRKKREIVKQ